MKKILFSTELFLIVWCTYVCAQVKPKYRYDTIQIEQKWKKHLTNIKDTSYLKVCIPNNDLKPAYDCDYDGFVVICDDGAIIRLTTIPMIPLNIENEIIDVYGDTILNSFGNNYLYMLQKEFYNVNIIGLPADSTFFHPQPIILEGLGEDGLCWKLKRMEYICISYEHVLPKNKSFYDFILSEYKFLNRSKIDKYRHLPLY